MNPLLAVITLLPEKAWTRIRNRRLGNVDLREEQGRLVTVDKITGEVQAVSEKRAMRLAEILCQSVSDRSK